MREVLNFNIGTILAAFVLRKLGVRNQFKISVFMGIDNPWSVLWLLMGARLLGGADGATSLSGINFSNSADSDTLRAASAAREALGLREAVRFEHHVTEAYKSIVRQPYERRAEVVEIAAEVPNISAEHEGGDPAVEASRKHRSDILDYFISRERDRGRRRHGGPGAQLLGQARRAQPHRRRPHSRGHRGQAGEPAALGTRRSRARLSGDDEVDRRTRRAT